MSAETNKEPYVNKEFSNIIPKMKEAQEEFTRPNDRYETVFRNIDQKTKIPTSLPITGKGRLFKRIVHKLINFEVKPRNEVQNTANRALTGAIGNVLGYIREQDAKLEEQRMIIDGLNSRIKFLEEKLSTSDNIRIFQITPGLKRGDGVGNDVLAIHNYLKYEKNVEAKIFYFSCSGKFNEKDASIISAMPETRESDILIIHIAIFWNFLDKVKDIPGRKIFVYHNITPYEFFEPFDQNNTLACKKGVEQVKAIKDIPVYCLADSEFNKADLLSYGYKCPIDVLPIIIPFEDYNKEPDVETINRLNDGLTNILFVGRISPNKKQEDIINAFSYYQKNINSSSRLILLGGFEETDLYYKCLKEYTDELKVQNVEFTRHVPFEQVIATLKKADVFVCMSEHEGFCIPLLEAMHFEIPIVAYDSTAIKYTMGDGGILLDQKDPKIVAEAIDKIVNDKALREDIIEKQRERLKEMSYENITNKLWKYLTDFEPRLVND